MASAGREPFVDAYAVLGVGADASDAELKRAHRALVRRHHPDVLPPAQRAAATRRVQQINVAYGLVRDPATRAGYDRLRRARSGRAPVAAAGRPRPGQAGGGLVHVDAAAAAAWDAAARAAGRWAGAWWRRNRRSLRRRAVRARVVGLDAVGRVLWLVSCLFWTLAGVAVAVAAQRLAGVEGPITTLTAALMGMGYGSRRGWRRRLRLAGLGPPAARPALALAAGATLVLAAALAVDAGLG